MRNDLNLRSKFSPTFPRLAWAWMTLALAATLMSAAGCQRIAPVRTLPAYYRGVYIPMVRNESFEPGLEEVMTRKIQEAFLADGRLDVVPKKDADLTLVATVTNFDAASSDSRGDHVASGTIYRIRLSLKLLEPFDDKKLIANLGSVSIVQDNNSDIRSVSFEPEPERFDRLAERVGAATVLRTLTGFPVNTADLPPGVEAPTPPQLDTLLSDPKDAHIRGFDNDRNQDYIK